MATDTVLTFGLTGLVASRLADLHTTSSFTAPRQPVDIADHAAVRAVLSTERPLRS